MEHEDREHDKQILDHMANAQPNENLDIYYEIPCASYPCQNGGTCEIIDHRYLVGEEEKHDYSYKCLCVDGFLGINCQRVRSACDVNDPCFNGRCVPDEENVKPTCFCLPGYQGDTCNEVTYCFTRFFFFFFSFVNVDECIKNDCSNHASCQNTEGSYKCTCNVGFLGDGKQCVAEEVKIKLQDPSVCTQYMEGSKKCRIVTNDIGSCDVEIEVVVTGHYMTQQIKWFHYFAKLNRTRVHSTQFTRQEVGANKTKMAFNCEEKEFVENYLTVEVHTGHTPPPQIMIKIYHKSIELGPQTSGAPFSVSVYNFDLFPGNDWIGKWIQDKTHEYEIIEPPGLTYEYQLDLFDGDHVGYLTYYAYNGSEVQVASRKFHDELDENECELGTHECNEHSDCENTPSSYVCICHMGYHGDGKLCTDIDECTFSSNNYCDRNALCTNLPGSYECVCNNGYHGDGHRCTEVDCPVFGELTNGHISKHSHSFHDTVTFTCYNGFRLVGSSTITCLQTGQWSAEQPVCRDHDECAADMGYCHSSAICTNLPGSFKCSCRMGYRGDGTSCIDIDECKQNPCHNHAICTNRDGGFTCSCYHTVSVNQAQTLSSCETYNGFRNMSLMRKHSEKQNSLLGIDTSLSVSPLINNNQRRNDTSKVEFAAQGYNYRISCLDEQTIKKKGDSVIEIVWLNKRKKQRAVHNSLFFNVIMPNDSGLYKCKVLYTDGSEEIHEYFVEVYVAPYLVNHLSVTYVTARCYDDANLKHKEHIIAMLKDKVCFNGSCEINKVEMSCNIIEEDEVPVHELTFKYLLAIVNSGFTDTCNITCLLKDMQSRMQKAFHKLQDLVYVEESTASKLKEKDFRIVKNSLSHELFYHVLVDMQ
ncbi:uncharacterized protein LOC102808671 [Saccoglossus kowalevskii]